MLKEDGQRLHRPVKKAKPTGGFLNDKYIRDKDRTPKILVRGMSEIGVWTIKLMKIRLTQCLMTKQNI